MSEPRTVLLIDDNDELRAATRELLQEMGYAVVASARGDEALDRVASGQTYARFDVLVTDVFMPGPSGLEVAERLLADQRGLAVVLMSSRGGEAELQRRLAAGDVSFLAKPFAPEDLSAKIRQAIDRSARRGSIDRSGQPVLRDAEAAAPAPRSAVSSRRSGASRLAAWQMAAVALLVLGLGVWIRSLEVGAPPLPEPVAESVERSLSIEAQRPRGSIPAAPEELAWRAAAAARIYEVRLLAVDGTVLWQAEVEAPRAELPAAVVASLHRGVIYYWSVAALDANQRRLASSGPVPFSIDPESRPSANSHRG